MPRNGSGSCSLAEAPFIPNTPISSANTNSNNDDIISMLTDSLSRAGDGGMQAVLDLDNSGFVYGTDPNTGMRRTAGDEQAIQCGGVDVIAITPTGAAVDGDLEVTGALTVAGNPLLLIGEIKLWSGITKPANWQLCGGQALLRATYPDLWAFAAAEIAAGNLLFTNGNGTTTFTVPDFNGRVPAGNDNGAGHLTATTMTPDGVTLGAIGGAQTETILQANLPAATLATTITSGQPHTHSITGLGLVAVNNGGGASQGNLLTTVGGSATTLTSGNNSATIAASTALGGSGTALTNVQPTIIVNYIIYAGA